MEQRSTVTIGCDLGDKRCEVCVLGDSGEVLLRRSVSLSRRSLRVFFGQYAGAVVVIEAGCQSQWISEALTSMGCEVVVANPRQVKLIGQASRKNDRRDAELLARLGRADRSLLAPVQHRGRKAQQDLVWIRARDLLVRSRASMTSCVRGLLKTFGVRVKSCHTDNFARWAREVLPAELAPALEPTLATIATLTTQIKHYDKSIETLAQSYPETTCMQQICGVASLTSLAYVLTLEDPSRYKKSRDVGPYLGMTPRQRQSGDSDPQLHVSKQGDGYLRRLLVGSAQYILGPFGPDTDLRRYGLKLVARGGKKAKKIAVVAVARKLAVLMHRLWVSQENYVPIGYKPQMAR